MNASDIAPPFDVAALKPLLKEIVSDAIAEANASNNRLAFTESEAAELLGTKYHVLRDARSRGEIEHTRIGRRIAYTRQQLDNYLSR